MIQFVWLSNYRERIGIELYSHILTVSVEWSPSLYHIMMDLFFLFFFTMVATLNCKSK